MVCRFTRMLPAASDGAPDCRGLSRGRLLTSPRKEVLGLMQQHGNVTKNQGPFYPLCRPQHLYSYWSS